MPKLAKYLLLSTPEDARAYKEVAFVLSLEKTF
jgi:hypothetical protein